MPPDVVLPDKVDILQIEVEKPVVEDTVEVEAAPDKMEAVESVVEDIVEEAAEEAVEADIIEEIIEEAEEESEESENLKLLKQNLKPPKKLQLKKNLKNLKRKKQKQKKLKKLQLKKNLKKKLNPRTRMKLKFRKLQNQKKPLKSPINQNKI